MARVHLVAEDAIAVELWRNSAQSILNDTPTDIIWHEGAGTHKASTRMWSNGDPSTIYFPEPGLWGVVVYIDFAANATGYRLVNIKKVNHGGDFSGGASRVVPVSGQATQVVVPVIMTVAMDTPNQGFRVQVRQTSGGALNVNSTFDNDHFSPDVMIYKVTRAYNPDYALS